VLVGGFDRGVDWTPFVDAVRARAPGRIVTMGANGPAIAARLRDARIAGLDLREAGSLATALGLARDGLGKGSTILLSPGAPSFDAFRDYAERGREFARLAGFDAQTITGIEGLGIA
jgi:UDP-N-acetylmuramoylalanine-D-glutamate ligase